MHCHPAIIPDIPACGGQFGFTVQPCGFVRLTGLKRLL
jgi:hypothetical protein